MFGRRRALNVNRVCHRRFRRKQTPPVFTDHSPPPEPAHSYSTVAECVACRAIGRSQNGTVRHASTMPAAHLPRLLKQSSPFITADDRPQRERITGKKRCRLPQPVGRVDGFVVVINNANWHGILDDAKYALGVSTKTVCRECCKIHRRSADRQRQYHKWKISQSAVKARPMKSTS